MAEECTPRLLFGGAVAVSLPPRFQDVSDFRTVPDNQEAFTDANLDQSIIIEFVEHHSIPDNEAGEFYFDDLAAANDAVFAKMTELTPLKLETLPGLKGASYCCIVVGEQAASKGRESALNKVHVQILVARLPSHGTDMLVTLNTPIFISQGSTAAEQAGSGYKEAHLSAPQLFQQVVSTLRILDWSLFGDSTS